VAESCEQGKETPLHKMWEVSRLTGCNNIVLACELLLRHGKMRLKFQYSDSAPLTDLKTFSQYIRLNFFYSSVVCSHVTSLHSIEHPISNTLFS